MTADGAPAGGWTCREVIGLLAEYLESSLTPEQRAVLDHHMAGCEPCQAYLNTYRRTRALTAQEERIEMPEEMRRRLRGFLLSRLASRDA